MDERIGRHDHPTDRLSRAELARYKGTPKGGRSSLRCAFSPDDFALRDFVELSEEKEYGTKSNRS